MITTRLPAKLDFDTLPVGSEGLYQWIGAVREGTEAHLVFEPGERDLTKIADVFGMISRAFQLVAMVAPGGSTLEMIEGVAAAAVDAVAAKAGTLRLCGDCGLVWVQEGATATHCACGARIDDAAAKLRAEQSMREQLEPEPAKPEAKTEAGPGWF